MSKTPRKPRPKRAAAPTIAPALDVMADGITNEETRRVTNACIWGLRKADTDEQKSVEIQQAISMAIIYDRSRRWGVKKGKTVTRVTPDDAASALVTLSTAIQGIGAVVSVAGISVRIVDDPVAAEGVAESFRAAIRHILESVKETTT